MKNVLTCWKEIAVYLGKGVRTVQRWEAMFGLPVRRAGAGTHRAVLAIPEELDAWLLNQGVEPHSELDCLRRQVVELRSELASLRQKLGQRGEIPCGTYDLLVHVSEVLVDATRLKDRVRLTISSSQEARRQRQFAREGFWGLSLETGSSAGSRGASQGRERRESSSFVN